MKQTEILKILAKDLKAKSADLAEVNKSLKAKDSPSIKYRLSGKALGHYGFTGLIKALTAQGVKVFEVNKVTLIPFESIEKMEIAKPREKRIQRAEKVVEKPADKSAKSDLKKGLKKSKPIAEVDFDDDDEDDLVDDNLDDEDFIPVKRKKKPVSKNKTGSKYIPGK